VVLVVGVQLAVAAAVEAAAVAPAAAKSRTFVSSFFMSAGLAVSLSKSCVKRCVGHLTMPQNSQCEILIKEVRMRTVFDIRFERTRNMGRTMQDVTAWPITTWSQEADNPTNASNLDLRCGVQIATRVRSPFALSGSSVMSVGQRGIFAQTTQLLVPATQTIPVSWCSSTYFSTPAGPSPAPATATSAPAAQLTQHSTAGGLTRHPSYLLALHCCFLSHFC
jgi:hypothetical protein